MRIVRSAIAFTVLMTLVAACSGRGLGPGEDGSVSPDGTVPPDGTVHSDGTAPGCGDGIPGVGEQCDGANLGGATCATLGYVGGDLACTSTCLLDRSGCITEDCGNGVLDADEDCDGANLGGATCATLGYDGGDLACTVACHHDPSGCFVEDCGNGAIDAGEDCDGASLGGATCATLGFDGGALACNGTCTFDTSACTLDSCGNGVLDPGEACDGNRLGGATCVSLGHLGGTLACTADCTLDETGCTDGVCGNGLLEWAEVCDGLNLGGATCASLGFPGGSLGCSALCTWDTTGCQGACAPAGPDLGCADDRSDDTSTSPEVTDVIDQWTGAGCQSWPMTGPERVYPLPPAATPQGWQIDLTGLSSDLDLIVLRADAAGCRASLPCVTWSDNGGTTSESVTFLAEAGVAYLVVVDGYAEADGPYTLSLTCVNPEICDDGQDNDGDGDVDCDDGDCAGQPGCVVQQIFEVFPYGNPNDAWDLSGVSLTFVPSPTAPNGFTWSAVDGVNAYPVTPGQSAGATVLAFGAMNDTVEVNLPNGRSFPFYGASYTSFWVNSHGNLTFGAGDTGNQESAAALTAGPPRISPCWDRFDVTLGATVSVDRLTDRIVVTWDHLQDMDTHSSNQIQAELWWTGQIRLTTVYYGGTDALTGVSAGGGGTGAPEVNFFP